MALCSPKLDRKKLIVVWLVPIWTLRLVYHWSSPVLFLVPSILNNFLGTGSHLIGSLSHFIYCRFIKFSVAPESTRAIASALFARECIKKWTVIDFLADKYTLLLFCLTKADLIKLIENPPILPIPQQALSCLSDLWHSAESS